MAQSYEQLVEKISKVSGLSIEEINQKVDAKCAKLSGLISKEGSAQIVASELGINFENEKAKISELMTGMRKVSVTGKIINMNPVREFTTKKGTEGKVLGMTIADDTGNVRAVLWDTNHIGKFENNEINQGDVVDISNAGVRNDELHLGSFSDIKKSNEVFDNIVTEKQVSEKKIADFKPGDSVKLRGTIVQMFEPRFFEVCPQCNKKVTEGNCAEHGSVTPLKRALIGIVLDDGSENMKGVLFSEQINKLGISEQELNSPELFLKKKEELLGEEMFFNANVRQNKLFNNTEFIVNDIQPVELDSLIESLK